MAGRAGWRERRVKDLAELLTNWQQAH